MKKLTSFSVLVGSAASTLLLAVGFTKAAIKFDPVSQKALTISTMQTGEVAALPCVSCTVDERQAPLSGNGLTESGNDTYVA